MKLLAVLFTLPAALTALLIGQSIVDDRRERMRKHAALALTRHLLGGGTFTGMPSSGAAEKLLATIRGCWSEYGGTTFIQQDAAFHSAETEKKAEVRDIIRYLEYRMGLREYEDIRYLDVVLILTRLKEAYRSLARDYYELSPTELEERVERDLRLDRFTHKPLHPALR